LIGDQAGLPELYRGTGQNKYTESDFHNKNQKIKKECMRTFAGYFIVAIMYTIAGSTFSKPHASKQPVESMPFRRLRQSG
jgi:hypothetical protein